MVHGKPECVCVCVCVCVCMSDYSETVITVLWEWQQEKDTVCFEGDLLMICPFLILPLSWLLSKCVFTLAFILFDVMLVLFALSITCPLDLVGGSSDFIVLLPTCNSNKTSGGRAKQSCNKLYSSCIHCSYCSPDYPCNIHNVSSIYFCFLQPQAVYSHNICSLILILLYQRLLVLITF